MKNQFLINNDEYEFSAMGKNGNKNIVDLYKNNKIFCHIQYFQLEKLSLILDGDIILNKENEDEENEIIEIIKKIREELTQKYIEEVQYEI